MGTWFVLIFFIFFLVAFKKSDVYKKWKENYNQLKVVNQNIRHLNAAKIKQILECIYTCENTKKLDTLQSAFTFLGNEIPSYITVYTESMVKRNVKEGTSLYLRLYYDRTLSTLQTKILENPKYLEETDFWVTCIVNFFLRYCESMRKEIDSLKTQKAKDRRKDMIDDTGKKCAQMLCQYGAQDKVSQITDKMKEFDINVYITFVHKEKILMK